MRLADRQQHVDDWLLGGGHPTARMVGGLLHWADTHGLVDKLQVLADGVLSGPSRQPVNALGRARPAMPLVGASAWSGSLPRLQILAEYEAAEPR